MLIVLELGNASVHAVTEALSCRIEVQVDGRCRWHSSDGSHIIVKRVIEGRASLRISKILRRQIVYIFEQSWHLIERRVDARYTFVHLNTGRLLTGSKLLLLLVTGLRILRSVLEVCLHDRLLGLGRHPFIVRESFEYSITLW